MAASKKPALGRGLDALLRPTGDGSAAVADGMLEVLAVSAIQPGK